MMKNIRTKMPGLNATVKNRYIDVGDLRQLILEMIEDGLVLVGNVNCDGHDLRYVGRAYHAHMQGHEVLILETENFVPYVNAEPEERIL